MVRAPSAPFEPLHLMGESITLDTTGKVLVLPVEDPDTTLPGFNQKTLDPDILSISESPFGGYNGALDHAPGSLHVTLGDEVYLTDVAGNNLSKDLSAGKLQRLGYLTVDPVAHTITEEFIIANTATSNNTTVIDNCDSEAGWALNTGTSLTFSADSSIKVSGTASVSCIGTTSSVNGSVSFAKTVNWNLTGKHFISFKLRSTLTGTLYFKLSSDTNVNQKTWAGSRFPISANTWTSFNLPLNALAASSGQNPEAVTGTLNLSAVTKIFIGVFTSSNSAACTVWIDEISSDVAKTANIELLTTNDLADTSMVSQKWNGSAYETNRVLKLDPVASIVSADTTKMVFGDQTKFDDVYGTGNGRSNFPKGVAGQAVSGTLAGSSMTYSVNKGTSKRVGFMVQLPPSDGGRTAFNTVRFKVITYYTDTVGNVVPDLSGNGKDGAIIGNLLKSDAVWSGFGTNYIRLPIGLLGTGSTGSILARVIPASLDMTSSLNNIIGVVGGSGPADYNKTPYFRSESGRIAAYLGNSATATIDTANKIISTVGKVVTEGILNTVCLSWEDVSATIYINEFTPDTFTLVNYVNIPQALYSFAIGSYYTTDRNWNGSIQEVVFYSRKITDEEYIVFKNGGLPSNPVARYMPSAVNMGSTTYEFDDSTNAVYGLQNQKYPWVALLDSPRTDILPDSSINNLDGAMTNVSLAYDNISNPYGAVKLNGSGSSINCGNSSAFNVSTAMTMVCWLKVLSTPTSYPRIMSKELTNDGTSFGIYLIGDGTNRLGMTTNSIVNVTATANNAVGSDWIRVVFTFDKPTAQFFINGTASGAAGTYNANLATTAYNLLIGNNSANTRYSDMLLADFRLYNRAWSQAEITDDAAGLPVSSEGLLGQWNPYQPSEEIDFFLPTHRFKNLSLKRDESGNIYEITLFPGNGQIYHGRITYADFTRDTGSTLVPDCLKEDVEGSITKFLESCGMVID